ncbi:MAG TPA: polyphenol oxidase family protein [Solirubrobacteraceae bacterium]
MKLPSPFHAAGDHIAIELPGARALFTTRRGGVSRGPFESLNLGRLTDDDPSAVDVNRSRVADAAGVRLVYGRQVHGTRVCRVGEAPVAGADPIESDGQATALRGLGPMVFTADCLPIAIATSGAVTMVHAGWRGLADGVIAEGVAAIRELDGGAEPVAAAIGPGAGPCCYETGPEVHARFERFGAGARNRANLDMKAIARAQLREAGVGEIHDAGLCTICSDPSLFFSHRRDRGITGRQVGVAWLS